MTEKRRTKRGYGILWAIWTEVLIRSLKNNEFGEANAGWTACQLKVSLAHLSRTFKIVRGISLHEFIEREKIKRAEILLKRYPKIKIKQVAETLGYSSASYFARVFMKYHMMSPVDYQFFSYIGLLDKDWEKKLEKAQTRPEVTPTTPETTHTTPEVTPILPEITRISPEAIPI